jgi:hypothetical protein
VCGPQHFVEALTDQKKLLYLHVVLLYIKNIYIYIYIYIVILISNFNLSTVLFLNIVFWCNTLFSYTSKNILLVLGLIFSVFLWPDEHLQVSECPVAVLSVISEVHLSTQRQ